MNPEPEFKMRKWLEEAMAVAGLALAILGLAYAIAVVATI